MIFIDMRKTIRKLIKESSINSRIKDFVDGENTFLDLSDLGLSEIPPIPEELIKSLRWNRLSIDLSNNKLKEIPINFLSKLWGIEELNLNNNPISNIGDLSSIPKLSILSLDDTLVQDIPAETQKIYLFSLSHIKHVTDNMLHFASNEANRLYLDRRFVEFDIDHIYVNSKRSFPSDFRLQYRRDPYVVNLFNYVTKNLTSHTTSSFYNVLHKHWSDYFPLGHFILSDFGNKQTSDIKLIDYFNNREMASGFYNLIMSGDDSNYKIAMGIFDAHG